MFNSKHYIPILRWKAAEKEALQYVDPATKKFMTPLIELIMPIPKTNKKESGELKSTEELLVESIGLIEKAIPKIPNDILECWGKSPVFLDVNLLDISVRVKSLTQIFANTDSLGIPLIPVVGLNYDTNVLAEIVAASKKYDHGLCLRLFRSDFVNTIMLVERIKKFLQSHRLFEKRIDLIIDLQIADEGGSDIASFCKSVPSIQKWRTFSVASGAFPPDLVKFEPNIHHIERDDWNSWLHQIQKDGLVRKPSYADYTIQHPIYKEPPRGSNPSASIRYTLKNQWMLMRGQALRSKKSAGFAQYPALAQLVSNQREFFGAKFSYGDKYIYDKGKDIKTKETGTPRTWLRAGINHHMTCVVSQISNLS